MTAPTRSLPWRCALALALPWALAGAAAFAHAPAIGALAGLLLGAALGAVLGTRLRDDLAERATALGAGAGGRGDDLGAALDEAAAAMAAMKADQRRAITTRLEGARLRAFVLAGVSHDLRGPLNSLVGFTEILREGVDGPLTEAQAESVEALARGGRALLRRVDDLLDAARLDAGRMTLDRVTVPLRELLEAARSVALERLGDTLPDPDGVRIDGALDGTLVADRARMAQALGAVLAFARTAAPDRARAEVRRDPTGQPVLTVSIPGTAALRAWLEDPLEVPPAGVRAPVGLGLAVSVARRILALHGGALDTGEAADGHLTLRARLGGDAPTT